MKAARTTKSCRRSASKGITTSIKKNGADTGLSPSKRHREKLNTVMDELCDLLPLSKEVKTSLDRLSVLKLTVSFFQTQSLMISTRSKQCEPSCSKEEQTTHTVEGLNLSELALQAIGGFFMVLTEDGVVYYISENVQSYLGYCQTRLMHQEFFPHVHPDDLQGLKSCFNNLKGLSNKSDSINTSLGAHQQCFCNIRCHAGRLSSHVSPFYYKCFKFYGRLKPVKSKSPHGVIKYGFFALCSPVDRQAEVFRPLSNNVEKYTCKMDAAYKNLEVDTRGLKYLGLGEKDLMGRSAYSFFHPEDLAGMASAHELLLKEAKVCITFRVLKGNGKWQWVRGRAYSIVSNGKVQGMVTKNFFISDEEGEYFKKQDIKEIQEWKARQSLALPYSQDSSSYESSSPSSGSMSPGSGSFYSFPLGPMPAMEAPPAQEELPSAHPLPQLNKPKAKSSCLVNEDPLPLHDSIMDNDMMLKVIRDLQNSLLDGTTRGCQLDLFSGPHFSETLRERNVNLPFVEPSVIPTSDVGFGHGIVNSDEHNKPFNDIDSRHLGTNGLNLLQESMLFHNNKLDNTSQVNKTRGSHEGPVPMEEHSFPDFVPLPLVEVENILSSEKSTHTMTSPYDMPPVPTSLMDMTPAYHDSNSYNCTEQKLGPIGVGYGLVTNQVLKTCANRMDNTNGFSSCSD